MLLYNARMNNTHFFADIMKTYSISGYVSMVHENVDYFTKLLMETIHSSSLRFIITVAL